MMFLVEAANTVKRYSAFPKTITSNPKSHFVFGVLPIAHIVYCICLDSGFVFADVSLTV